MKRRVGKVALFLLLGAILNVAVAWEAAFSVHLERGVVVPDKANDDYYMTGAGGLHWGFWFVRGPGVQRTTAASELFAPVSVTAEWFRPDLVPRWSRMQLKPDNDEMLLAEDACGWPL